MEQQLVDFQHPDNMSLLQQLVFENSVVQSQHKRAADSFFPCIEQFASDVRAGKVPQMTLLKLNKCFASTFAGYMQKQHVQQSASPQSYDKIHQKRTWDDSNDGDDADPPLERVTPPTNGNQFDGEDSISQPHPHQSHNAKRPSVARQGDVKNVLKKAAPSTYESSKRVEILEHTVAQLKQECERLSAQVNLLLLLPKNEIE